jgi:hypothetical protein
MVAMTNPSATERCDVMDGETPDPLVHDQDCDGSIDEGCACTEGADRGCGGTEALAMTGTCRPGTQTCETVVGGTEWGTCSSIEPAANEACDGLDDDCDGSTDESFSCEQNETVSGPTTCGNPGTRRCSATCNWIDTDFYSPESSGTCDYCDDTGTGIASELSFATNDKTLVIDGSSARYGAAGTFDGDLYLLLGGSSQRGSAVTPAQVIGHGEITFEARMDVAKGTTPPGTGWALWMVRTGTGGDPIGAVGIGLGVPRDRHGFAAEWTFQGNDGDDIWLRRLHASGSDPVLEISPYTNNPSLDGATSGMIEQGLRITATPDVPGTAADETAITVTNLTSFTPTEVASCGGGGTPCGWTLTPGDTYLFGVSASSSSYTSTVTPDPTTDPAVTIRDLCPGD